jgi:hypothetical protein
MVIVKLQGGLGNQMFQFAIGKILAEKNRTNLFLDKSFFLDQVKKPGYTPRQFALSVFNPKCYEADEEMVQLFYKDTYVKRFRKLIGLPYKKVYYEPVCYFDETLLSMKVPLYLDGYFQSEKYFKGYTSLVRKLFEFPTKEYENYTYLLKQMDLFDSVSVHFRRGDYISDEVTCSFHGFCTLDYYIEAFEIISSQLKHPHFYIFSDDISWVQQQLEGWVSNITFIKSNTESKSWVDIMLMSKCKHHIIANSSFSWWGAWLNPRFSKKVIAPKKWFTDPSVDTTNLIPESWIRI